MRFASAQTRPPPPVTITSFPKKVSVLSTAAGIGLPGPRAGIFQFRGTVEVMSYYLLYTLAFLAIGLFAGHVSKDDLPGGALVGARAGYALGVAGALAGGLSWLALRGYGWGGIQGGTQAGQGPEARAYAHLAGDTSQ